MDTHRATNFGIEGKEDIQGKMESQNDTVPGKADVAMNEIAPTKSSS